MPAPQPLALRLSHKLQQDGACIVWTGARRPNGYGVVGGSRNGRKYYDQPHRVVYRLTRGEIPAGHQIDHLCRNRLCVNPQHLEAITQAENVRRENAFRWHGIETRPSSLTTIDLTSLVALLTGTRP